MSEEIDVSGCCLYKDGICLTDKGKCTSMCDYGAYAREEELKRLEAENAKLKGQLEKIRNLVNRYRCLEIIEGAEE